MEQDTPWPSATDVHPSLAGATNYDQSHEDYWEQITLKEAVARGVQLRALKVRAPRKEKVYKVISLEYIKRPPVSKRCSPTCRYAPSKYKNARPKQTRTPLGTCDFTTCKKYHKSLKCSMRIEELAIPSKRKCLDTWRENYKILPEVMINRLREHVLDQRPVFRVDDAIRCFRTKRKIKKKSSFKRLSGSSLRVMKSEKDMHELRCLCGKLAGRACRKLMVPLKIRLNLEQQRVAQIVARDIKEMMRSQKLRCQYVDLGYQKILSEVSNMVSVWIATILYEASNRLLDDALRELEEDEGPVLDILDSIVEFVVTSEDHMRTPTEAYSESDHNNEGEIKEPLHIEQMVNETGDSGHQEGVKETEVPKAVDQGKGKVEVESETDYVVTEDATSFKHEVEDDGDQAKFSFRSELGDDGENDGLERSILPEKAQFVDKEKGEATDEKDNYDTNIHYDNQQEKHEGMEEYPDAGEIQNQQELDKNINDTNEQDTELQHEDKVTKYEETSDEMEESHKPVADFLDETRTDISKDNSASERISATDIVNEDKGEDIKQSKPPETEKVDENKLDASRNIKASEGFHGIERMADGNTESTSPLENEEFLDADDKMTMQKEDDKKVTFDSLGADLQTVSESKQKISTGNLNPPNQHILSDADELWPSDMILSMDQKPLEAVNKSVTSLGNIKESVEKVQVQPIENEETQLNRTTDEYVDALTVQQPSRDNISSQTASAMQSRAQETEPGATKTPPIIPFNKSTETGEEKFTEIKDDDGLYKLREERVNKIEQTTGVDDKISSTDEKIANTQETAQPKALIDDATIDESAEMQQNEKLEPENEVQDKVFMEDNQRKALLETSEKLAQVEQFKSELTLEEGQRQPTITNELHQSGESLAGLEPVTEVIDELAKFGDTKDIKPKHLGIQESIPISDVMAMDKLEKELNAFLQPHKQENLHISSKSELPHIKSDNNVIAIINDMKDPKSFKPIIADSINKMKPKLQTNINDETESKFIEKLGNALQTPKNRERKDENKVPEFRQRNLDKKVVTNDKMRGVREILNKARQKGKPDHEQKPEETRAPKLVLNLTKYLSDIKSKNEQISGNLKRTKRVRPDAKQLKLPSKEESYKPAKKSDIKSRLNASKKPISKSQVTIKPAGEPKADQTKNKQISLKPTPETKMEDDILLTQPKFDYRVRLETAPSWVLNQGKGEPSEDSLLTHIKERQRLQERKLRQWCHDLEVTAINLEKWTNWIDDATANIMCLKRNSYCAQRRDMAKASEDHNKNWAGLKTCIDKDALLWSKLCHRAVRKLDAYNSMLKNKVEPSTHKDQCPCRMQL